jgi:hypothetical protein
METYSFYQEEGLSNDKKSRFVHTRNRETCQRLPVIVVCHQPNQTLSKFINIGSVLAVISGRTCVPMITPGPDFNQNLNNLSKYCQPLWCLSNDLSQSSIIPNPWLNFCLVQEPHSHDRTISESPRATHQRVQTKYGSCQRYVRARRYYSTIIERNLLIRSRSPVSSSVPGSDSKAKGSNYRVLHSHASPKPLSESEPKEYMDTYWSGFNNQLCWLVRHPT